MLSQAIKQGVMTEKRAMLLEDFKEVSLVLKGLKSLFEMEVEDLMIEYYILRIKAEEKRRECIVKKLKEITL